MKSIKSIHTKWLIIWILSLSLISCKKNTSTALIVFDVTANYPVKTLDIEEVSDIEYLTLEINDDFLFRSFTAMTDSYILCTGMYEIIFFDRITGKAVSKVSRRGQGPGEYNSYSRYVYDEKKDELFLNDGFEIKVYGKDGTFKRKFSFMETRFFIHKLFDYDDEHLLLYGYPSQLFVSQNVSSLKDTSFLLVSKQDGFIDSIIPIPFEERISIVISQGSVGGFAEVNAAIRNGNDFLLTDYSSDTVYHFTPDRQLIPVLVRTPSIQKMETKIFLHSWLETGNYLFFSTQKIDFDWNTQQWPPAKGYLKEKKTGKFFQTNIRMNDYKEKEFILGPAVIYNCPNQQTGIIVFSALELKDAYRDNKLSGKLKEATERLTEDDEYVFMILKFK